MNRITIKNGELVGCLNIGGNLAGKNKSIPILDMALFSVNEDSLTIRSTDRTVYVGRSCKVESRDSDVDFCMEPKRLFHVLKFINATESVELILNDDITSLTLRHSKGGMSFPVLSAKDFPAVPEDTREGSLKISGTTLFSWIKKADVFCSKISKHADVVHGVNLYAGDGKMGYHATDMGKVIMDSEECDAGFSMLANVPYHAFPSIQSVIAKEEAVEVTVGPRTVRFDTESSFAMTPMLRGTFPNCERLIPESNAVSVTDISTEELSKAISRIMTSDTFSVNISVTEEDIKITCAEFAKNIDAEEHVSCKSNGTIDISFFINTLNEVISSITSSTISMHFTNKMRPVLIEESDLPNQKILQMPIINKLNKK